MPNERDNSFLLFITLQRTAAADVPWAMSDNGYLIGLVRDMGGME
jgi:hypothetical protein